MLSLQVIVDCDGFGPCKFEKFCQELIPPARARIIETDDDRRLCHPIYQCHWILEVKMPMDVQYILSNVHGLEARVQKTGGRVLRLRVGVPMHFDNGSPFCHRDYLEWIVPMTAKDRSNAYLGLRRTLKERQNLNVELSRDYLETMESQGAARFFVTMRVPSMPIEEAFEHFRALEFLDRWRNCRILNEPWGTRMLYDSCNPFDAFTF